MLHSEKIKLLSTLWAGVSELSLVTRKKEWTPIPGLFYTASHHNNKLLEASGTAREAHVQTDISPLLVLCFSKTGCRMAAD